jgi:hypothetical protein
VSEQTAAAPLAAPAPAAAAGAGRGPWATAFRKLRADRSAMAALLVVLLVVALCLLAPAYAAYIAKTDPFSSNLSGQITVAGKRVPVMETSPRGSASASPRSARPGTSGPISSAPTARAATSRLVCSMAGATRC